MQPEQITPSCLSTEYIQIPSYLGINPPTERYIVSKEAKNFSFSRFIAEVDTLFKKYLEATYEPHVVGYWKGVLETIPLSRVLREHFTTGVIPEEYQKFYGKGFDFDSSRQLSPEELVTALLQLSRIGDLVCGKFDVNSLARQNQCSALCQAVKTLFNDTFSIIEDNSRYEMAIEDFLTDLLRKRYFTKSESPNEIAEEERYRLLQNFSTQFNDLVSALTVAPVTPSEEETRLALIHRVCHFARTRTPEEMGKFTDLMGSFEPALSNILEQTEALLVQVSPRVAALSITEKTIGIAKYPGGIALLPLTNFYFSPQPQGEDTESEWSKFPTEGNCVGSKSGTDTATLVGGRFDVSVFDPEGYKVFWGDLLHSDIQTIKGPFYVLSQSDSYYDIPDEAVIDTRESFDSYREKKYGKGSSKSLPIAALLDEEDPLPPKRDSVRIDTSYMRAKALGRISDGAFVNNPCVLFPD